MRMLARTAALLLSIAASTACANDVEFDGAGVHPRQGIVIFDLHDPALMADWTKFLQVTPMINSEPVPHYLQSRLINVVGVYRSLTPAGRPAFFVATYFDVLSDRLFTAGISSAGNIGPMKSCPVFTSGNDAPVHELLAVASGLPGELFVNAPGRADNYRRLFLQTEFSHCHFLATMRKAGADVDLPTAVRSTPRRSVRLSFDVGTRTMTAIVTTRDELRALVETVGDLDAGRAFRADASQRVATDEAAILGYVRLLALLATDSDSGYAAIPVLRTLFAERLAAGSDVDATPFSVADALAVAFAARAAFREIVPFPVRNSDDLLGAKLAVKRALGDDALLHVGNDRLIGLLDDFVSGAELLLQPTYAHEKMPPVNNWRHPVLASPVRSVQRKREQTQAIE